MRFRNRRDAGAQLATALGRYAERPDVVVVALPRGGVPVGFEIAVRLALPLDVLVVRKLGVPYHRELAMGAIASGGIELLDDTMIRRMHVTPAQVAAVLDEERAELERRELMIRGDRPPLDVEGRSVILVDDGLATGASMLAAISALRTRHPSAIAVAVPVASPRTCNALRARCDHMVCLATPEHFQAVSVWYEDFAQTTDREVRELLAAAELGRHAYGFREPVAHA